MTQRFKESDVLSYRIKPHARATVRRYYDRWRQKQGLPDCCDIPECHFHTNPMEWNREPLLPVLDHLNGNRKDNTPQNLRYLCPNCDSQQPTRGGKNIGRVQNETDFGYGIANRDGGTDAKVFPPTQLLKRK